MTRSRPILLALVLAALVAGFGVWLALFEASDDGAESAAPAPSATERNSAPSGVGQRGLEAPSVARGSGEERASRAAVTLPSELELSEALWVVGRVHLPDGAPPDERIEIVAHSRPRDGGEYRARLNDDGTFRVAFAKGRRTGWLTLEAEHVYLPERANVRLDQLPDEVVLEARLGASLRGVVRPPPGFADVLAQLGSREVSCWSQERWAAATQGSEGAPAGGALSRSTDLDDELRFEFLQLPSDVDFVLAWDGGLWAPCLESNLRLAAGESREIVLEGRAGATIQGRVTARSGEPLAGAALELLAGDPLGRAGKRTTSTDKQGRFELRGVGAAATYTLRASCRGFFETSLALGALREGQLLDSVAITLDAGLTLAGVVTWPDGSPAQGAAVEIERFDPTGRRSPGSREQARTAADGSFLFSTLEEGLYNVAVEAVSFESAGSVAPAAADSVRRSRIAPGSANGSRDAASTRATWSARRERVAPGDALAIVLERCASVAGTVVDDLGAPIANFRVSALPATPDGKFRSPRDSVRARRLAAVDGRFRLEGLTPGLWDLSADAKGHASSETVQVEVTGALQVELRLERLAVLSGVVLDERGQPVKGAVVVANSDGPSGLAPGSDRSDENGRFDGVFAPAGAVKLHATHSDYARPEALLVQVGPGEQRTNLRLVLDGGASVRVQLAAELVRPKELWRVRVNPANAAEPNAASNAASPLAGRRSERHDFATGPCVFEHLLPGDYIVEAISMEALGPQINTRSDRRRLEQRVTVGRGALEVVLGGS